MYNILPVKISQYKLLKITVVSCLRALTNTNKARFTKFLCALSSIHNSIKGSLYKTYLLSTYIRPDLNLTILLVKSSLVFNVGSG